MMIGEKIKKLRIAKLMTQSELVGTEITRNMLSRIENGSANPSLDTVRYIAERLNVSPSFLLADEEDEKIYRKHKEIDGIKQAFMTEDFRICRDMCLHAQSASDDEIQMILAECNLLVGIEEFNNGNLRVACAYLDAAIESCEKTLYRTDWIVATAGLYFRYMRRFSATLSSNVIDEEEVNIYPSLTDEFCRYAYAVEKMGKGDPIESIESIARRDSPYALHLEAKLLMGEEKYEQAYEYLHRILLQDFPVSEPMLYFVFCDLEICCREIRDFKGAYEYSIDKVELFQKLLT